MVSVSCSARGDNAFELLPAAGGSDGLFKWLAISFCFKEAPLPAA